MKVIALRGAMKNGKSHTINIIYKYLLSEKWVQIPGFFKILGNPKFNDVFDILTKDGIKLGIIGMGDYQRTPSRLANLLKKQELNGCDIVICACRAIPNIERAVSQYTNHVFVDKTIAIDAKNYQVVNEIDTERVIKSI